MLTKILIVDDHTLIREGLKLIFAENPDIVVGGEADSGQEALKKVSENNYDIVLLDISLPDRNGLEILREIKNRRPDLPVIMLTMYPEEAHAIRALKAGASGYLTKKKASDELLEAVRKVSKGERCISSSLVEKLILITENSSEKLPHETLSDREYQVMCMIASGKTLSKIAEDLSLSINTISTFRQRILKKLNMRTNAELTHYAIMNQLVLE
jgi:DNA-binding NarL/FixJ family response regulator